MKYDIHRELKRYTRLKMPACTGLLPVMNLVMRAFRCKSDDTVAVTRHLTPGHGGAQLRTLVMEPKAREGTLPCVVFFHGGGFMLRASGTHYRIAKRYAERVPCKVVYADYRLAPRYPFPVPAEDCYQTYQWAREHADMLGIDADRVAVAGDSAGGNLAAAVTLMARDRGIGMPAAVMLVYPVTDRRMNTESMQRYTDTPLWDANLNRMMWDAYLGRQEPERVEYASPVEAESLARFPATYIEVAQFDALRDEGVGFGKKLAEAGVPVECHELKGACHGYEMATASQLVRDAMDRRIRWLQHALAQQGAGCPPR